ncbi:MAG: ABC transporter permease [Phycicoccus sp.]
MSVAAALLRAPVVLGGVSLLVFAATEALPGDAAEVRAGGRVTAAQLAELRRQSGLDGSAWQRYVEWVTSLATGDPGTSLLSGRAVGELIGQRLPATLTLAALALAVTVPSMLALAALAGSHSAVGRAAAGVVAACAAVPQVVVAAGLTALFAGALAWLPPVSLLPAGGAAPEPSALVLPVLSLAVPSTAYGASLLRGVVEDTGVLPHVRDAHLRGVAIWRVALLYIGPSVAAPSVRVLAVVAGGLVAATALVETLFGYAGLGELLTGAVVNRDTPVVQAIAMLAAAVVLAGLLAADLLAAVTDPRRRST